MNKCLLIVLAVLAVISIGAAFGGKEVGYEVDIKHIPKYSKYGYGTGQSVRYDKRIVPVYIPKKVVPVYIPKKVVPVYVPKKFDGEEDGLGYGGYGEGGLGLDGGLGQERGGFGLGVGDSGLGGAYY